MRNRMVVIGQKIAALLDENGRVPGSYIEMHSGAFVDPFHLDPELVFIEDIAFNLARIARFTGCSGTYGAEHVLIVEGLLARWGHGALVRLHGVVHDAHEAYLNDTPKPLKRRPEYAFYNEACNKAQEVILQALGIPAPTSFQESQVKRADAVSLLIEARRGLPSRGECWPMTTRKLIDLADEYALEVGPAGADHEELEALLLHQYHTLMRECSLG